MHGVLYRAVLLYSLYRLALAVQARVDSDQLRRSVQPSHRVTARYWLHAYDGYGHAPCVCPLQGVADAALLLPLKMLASARWTERLFYYFCELFIGTQPKHFFAAIERSSLHQTGVLDSVSHHRCHASSLFRKTASCTRCSF